jgi:hypothetical protein
MTKIKEKQPSAKPLKEGPHEKSLESQYYRWLEKGCPMDDDLTDWVEVEKKFPAPHYHV